MTRAFVYPFVQTYTLYLRKIVELPPYFNYINFKWSFFLHKMIGKFENEDTSLTYDLLNTLCSIKY